MHKAVREALCNAISNSDFYQPQGLIVHKYKENMKFINPGCLRMPVEKMFKGGDSNARNKTILKMFNLVGIGERAGNGFPQIVRACSEFGYDQPIIQDAFKPDRTTLTVFSVKKDDTKCDTKQPKLDAKYDTNENKIITYLSNADKAKAKDIASSIGLSLSTVKKILYKLVEEGIVSSIGTIKDKRYFISKNNS